jgi:hypothetical protein
MPPIGVGMPAILALESEAIRHCRLFWQEIIRRAFERDIGVDAFGPAVFARQNPLRVCPHGLILKTGLKL